MIGYSRTSWGNVLEQWNKDELETLAPPFHLNPYGGVKAIVNWSLKAGGERSYNRLIVRHNMRVGRS